jgi:hypothetical protein
MKEEKPWNDLSTACQAGEVDATEFFVGDAEAFVDQYGNHLPRLRKKAADFPNVFIRPKADESVRIIVISRTGKKTVKFIYGEAIVYKIGPH